MTLPSPRQTNLIIFLGCTALILIALYMQHVMGLAPCYLCITQRVAIITVAAIGLLACLHNPGVVGRRCYGILVALGATAGSFFSGKQLWLQSLPEDQVPACGPPADYLFDAFPLQQAISMLLRGDGNCAKVQWTFLDISIPGWTMVAFIGLAAMGIWQAVRKG